MKRWLGIGVPILLVLSLVGWRITAEKGEAEKLKSQQKGGRGGGGGGGGGQPPVVEVAVAGPKTILQSIEAVGTVEAPFVVRLSPKVTGRIEYLEVREGDAVTPGQPLVRIDPTELDAQVLQQQAAVSEARSRLAQAEMMAGSNETGIQSAIRVERAALESAQADLRQADKNYDALVGTAEAAVTDARARVAAAESEVRQRQAELKAAESVRRNAKARLDRLEAQLAKGYVSQQSVDDARTNFENADATVGVRENEILSAKSLVTSANAVLAADQKQLGIVKEKGQADVAAARARVKQAQARVDESLANRSQTPAYRQNLKALRASVEAAEAGLRQFQTRRSDTVLASPIEGTVTERTADPGSMASPGQSIVTVQYLKWVFVSASIPIEQSEKVYKGQPVHVRLDALPKRVFTGTIQQINRSADPQSRQFGIKIRLENPREEIRPGMFGRLDIVTDRTESPVVIPSEAVTKDNRGERVTVINDKDEAETRQVKTGTADRDGITITEGLKAGERVVTLSYSPVREGQKVRLPEAKGGAKQ